MAKNEIVFPQNPSLFPQSIRIQQQQEKIQKQNQKMGSFMSKRNLSRSKIAPGPKTPSHVFPKNMDKGMSELMKDVPQH